MASVTVFDILIAILLNFEVRLKEKNIDFTDVNSAVLVSYNGDYMR